MRILKAISTEAEIAGIIILCLIAIVWIAIEKLFGINEPPIRKEGY